MSISRLALMGAAGAGGGIAVEDAFSTDLYTGNASSQTITNGIDLAGEGGLVWAKCRSLSEAHMLFDTGRGVHNSLFSNSSTAESTSTNTLTGFNSDGFSIGDSNIFNTSGSTNVAWTFRKAPKFFDVVTYTGDGANNRTIPHNLGSTPGFMVVKRLDQAQIWAADHKVGQALIFNSTEPAGSLATYDSGVVGTGSVDFFTLTKVASSVEAVNATGGSYVAYLFAHNDAADGIIQCGSYIGNGSATGPVINIGWEPQWLLLKSLDGGSWFIYDTTRNPSNPVNLQLKANSADNEAVASTLSVNTTGFQITSSDGAVNSNGQTFIYMAIRAEGV